MQTCWILWASVVTTLRESQNIGSEVNGALKFGLEPRGNHGRRFVAGYLCCANAFSRSDRHGRRL